MRTFKSLLAIIAMLLCGNNLFAYDFQVDGTCYNILSAGDRTVEVASNGGVFGDIVIPSKVKFNNIDFTVTRIGNNSFINGADIEYQITSVSLPNTIVSIGEYAFRNCFSLESINIPEGVTTIEAGAFESSSCGNVSLPSSLRYIGDGAFQGAGMTYCKLPNQIKLGSRALGSAEIVLLEPFGSIQDLDGERGGLNAFNDDAIFILRYEEIYDNLIDFNVTSEMTYVSDGIPYSRIKFYDKSCFSDAEIQTLLETGGKIKQNGVIYRVSSLYNAFTLEVWGIDHAITTADIASKVNYLNREFTVTSIRDNAFEGRTALTTVKIPSTIKSIGNNAFAGCTAITEVTTESSTPLSINDGCFDVMTQLFATLYVPTGAVNTYKSAAVWKGFGNITEAGVSYKTLTLKANTGGTIACGGTTVNNGTEYVNTPNNSVTITFTPNTYHTLVKVLVNGNDVTSQVNNGELSININADTEIEAVFGTQSEVILQDEQTNFELDSDISCDEITYTRTLPNFYWNSLYVPFKIPYATLADDYEVAYINAVHSYDNDDNGTIDELSMEVMKIKAGTLKANYPYLIKARDEEAKSMTISLADAVLYAAEENTLDCSSVYQKFEITGSYSRKSAEDLEGSLAISTEGAWQPLATGTYLNPFRLYLTITNRDDSPVEVEPTALSRVRIIENGETTGILDLTPAVKKETHIFDLSGRRVLTPQKGQLYIVNGKKVVY